MIAPKPVQIVGGGLAGLTLGLALRRKEIPVTIFETGNYPRHRVCGEFISGRGLEILDELNLKQKLFAVGAIEARSAIFLSEKLKSPTRQLPSPAICLSRFVMDKLLADEFQKFGGELRVGERKNDFGEGVVRANGRKLNPKENGWRWFGLKAHAKNISLEADLEMHLGNNFYVGICKLAGDEANVCGLFRRNGQNDLAKNGFDLLRGNVGSNLHNRLANAEFIENSFCSVAGLSLKPQHASEKNGICVGDALTMIPPVTGNGMSLAFESAQIAAEPLAEFSRGDILWNDARRKIAFALDKNFSKRLRWANWLQQLMFSPVLQMPFGKFLFQSEAFWKIMFAKTR